MIGATMNEVSGRHDAGHSATFANLTARLLGLGYPIAAAALRFKNKPALRLMTVIFTVILLATTLLSSSHVSGLSLLSSLLFLAVNLFQILLMLWDLRPVALQGEAQMLHDFVFPNLTAAAFNKLARLAEWRDGAPGHRLAIQGSGVTEIIVDLRYNGGGLISMADLMGDLLGGNRAGTDVFRYMTYRPEKAAENETYTFHPQAESVSPTRIAFTSIPDLF